MSDLTAAENALGAEFWTQPQTALDTNFQLIYTQLIAVLREEARERQSSALDWPIIERIAFLYAYMRQREANVEAEGAAITDRTRREMNKDWIELVTAMKKLWGAEDKDNSREIVIKKLDGAIANGFAQLPDTEEVREIKRILAKQLIDAGI